MIKVVFFAALREQLDCAEMTLACENINTVADVKKALILQNSDWQNTFNNSALLSAVNHEMVASDENVKAGDEVAFFPPVTGG